MQTPENPIPWFYAGGPVVDLPPSDFVSLNDRNASVFKRITEGKKALATIARKLDDGKLANLFDESAPDLKNKPDHVKGTLGALLENERRFLNSLTETTRVFQIGNFDKFAFPLVRAIYPNLITNEIVSVQPMAGPVSLIFYLDFVFGSSKGSIQAGQSAFSAIAGPYDTRFYSSEDVYDEVIGTGNGTTTTFTKNANYVPIRNGTVSIKKAGVVIGHDNGTGGIVGTGINSANSYVNYKTGEIRIVFTSAPASGEVITTVYAFDSEANENIPQIDLQLVSSPVTARSRKLRARWSLEAAQNLNALHGLDAEKELLGALAEQIKFEIDREVINDLYNVAQAGSVAWSKTPPSGISYTEHKLSFIDACIEASNLIFNATKRGQANFLVASIGMCTVIESQPTFIPLPGALQTQANTGIIKIGTLNNRWTVYKDPFLGQQLPAGQRDIGVIGYKGPTFIDAGYVYAPYIPLYTTPTITLDDFIVRTGMATQYGKRVVNPRFYGTLLVTP